uniref:Protein kinase domain-containing protein n=1 Tax=Kalanchoe fedtschenkoi TaxID=63787 RepID=A0A7N0U739_KALFE
MLGSMQALLAAATLLHFFSDAVNPGSESELRVLLELKHALDPESLRLSSWNASRGAARVCDGSFEGVACHNNGRVANISLQGKGLTGRLPPAIGALTQLSGLYLHYNFLTGEIPREISQLRSLSDLYLNGNRFSGQIPPEIGNMAGVQVLQLCCNQLTGSIPAQLGALAKLNVLELRSNRLTGSIPPSLGNLGLLMWLDLSFNELNGTIPSNLADAKLLQVLDVRNNALSGNVPPGLMKLKEGFRYENNSGLLGVGYPRLEARPTQPKKNPQSEHTNLPCDQPPCTGISPRPGFKNLVIPGLMIVLTLSTGAIGILVLHRRRMRKLSDSESDTAGGAAGNGSADQGRKTGTTLISLEYSQSWDPFPILKQGFLLDLDEVEWATRYFSEANLLSKNGFSAIYRGVLQDGSTVAVKKVIKSSFKPDPAEVLKGLSALALLRHDNILRLRGFCCLRGRDECVLLVFDYAPNGSLSKFLDLDDGDDRTLGWSTRVSIIHGIAKGIEYLHGQESGKPALVYQDISADKVLLSSEFNPMLSGCGLHKLLANDVVFSALKASAGMGYLPPEYATTGKFTDKSDVYTFGVLILQIISGKRAVSHLVHDSGQLSQADYDDNVDDFIDPNLHGRFSKTEARMLVKTALRCSHESPSERPSLTAFVKELGKCSF